MISAPIPIHSATFVPRINQAPKSYVRGSRVLIGGGPQIAPLSQYTKNRMMETDIRTNEILPQVIISILATSLRNMDRI